MYKPNLLFVDYYELTSGRVNLDFNRNAEMTETYFFRRPLKGYQYILAVGQHHLIDFIMEMNEGTLTDELVSWLEKTGGGDLNEQFLDYLAKFKFNGTVTGVKVGTPMFSGESIINVTGRSIDVQILETYLLHVMNTQSPVATTASLLRSVAGKRSVADFGARRSFNPMLTAEAAIIGGADATSLVQAGKEFGVPYVGTIPHKFIQERWDGEMSFSDSELLAFREYAKVYPHNTVLLVDTYNTMNGILNAIIVGRELRKDGYELKGIRLDSGDLGALAKEARRMLNAVGLGSTRIYVSDNIDPWKAKKMLDEGAPIDGFGVGTRLVHPHEALGGIYKMVQAGKVPYMKFTDNPKKMTLPGKRNVWRSYDSRGMYHHDVQALYNEDLSGDGFEPLHSTLFSYGQPTLFPSVMEMKQYVLAELKKMRPVLKRTWNIRTNVLPVPYRVEMSPKLEATRAELIARYEAEFGRLNKKSERDENWKERMAKVMDTIEEGLSFDMNPAVSPYHDLEEDEEERSE